MRSPKSVGIPIPRLAGERICAVSDSRAACRVRKTGRAKRTLGKVSRALTQVVKTLRSRKARQIAEPLRTALMADAKAIQADVTLVKAGLVCP